MNTIPYANWNFWTYFFSILEPKIQFLKILDTYSNKDFVGNKSMELSQTSLMFETA